MKAIEYADIYRQGIAEGRPEREILSEIMRGLYGEIIELQKARKVSSNAGMSSIVKEIINKWKAITRIVNEHSQILNADGFEKVLERNIGIKITPTGLEEIHE